MERERIVTKALAKAIGNGWDMKVSESNPYKAIYEDWENYSPGKMENNYEDEFYQQTYFRGLILSRDFAKAFFGDEWWFRLVQLVQVEDPVNYLERFLND